MKNGLKNAALVLLTLATVGLAGKVINDSTGFVDKLIGKKPDSANYLQIGDELCGKTVYFDSESFKAENGVSGTEFGTLSTNAEIISGSGTITTEFTYVTPYLHMGIVFGVLGGAITEGLNAETGIYAISFEEVIHPASSANFEYEATSLKITGLNQTIDVNRYFAYSEAALTEWKDWRKDHPFEAPEITKPDSVNYLKSGDELLGKTLYVNVDHLREDGFSLQGSAKTLISLNVDDANSSAYIGTGTAGFGLFISNGPNSISERIDTASGGIQALVFDESYVNTTAYEGAYPISVASVKVASIASGTDGKRYFSWTENGTEEWAEYRAALFGQTSDQGTDVQEKARTAATYAHEVVPNEDTDARFGAFC